jgi:hypothetical protein
MRQMIVRLVDTGGIIFVTREVMSNHQNHFNSNIKQEHLTISFSRKMVP